MKAIMAKLPKQGPSQDLDSRVSKMCFGGDRVSWESNAARRDLARIKKLGA